MERILDNNERIKRAEELYLKKMGSDSKLRKVEKEKKRSKSYLFHLLLMLNITVIVFSVQNKEYIFSEEFLDKIKEYNITTSNSIITFVKDLVSEENEENVEKNETVFNNESQNEVVEANIVENSAENTVVSSVINQMEEDINNLKAYKFVLPIKGRVSSTFGSRVSEYQNVTGYHTGIDIAADSGTDILASMEGIVEEVSSKGDYGNHIKIRCNNVTTLYAHCSKIFAQEGQIVGRGQKIASVGSTGNSTGPHLHFEIRIENRFVDPGKVIAF